MHVIDILTFCLYCFATASFVHLEFFRCKNMASRGDDLGLFDVVQIYHNLRLEESELS